MVKRFNKFIAFLLAVSMLFSLPQNVSAKPQTEPPALKNISLMENFSTWGGTRYVKDGEYNANPAYKITASAGYGAVQFVPNWWQGFSLKDYEKDGVIEFYIKGAQGGETFSVYIKSNRYGKEVTNGKSSSELNISVTASWAHHKIPIKKLLEGMPSGFTIDNVTEIAFQHNKAQTYHISELYITSPGAERQYAIIKPNQTGYAPDSTKYALVSFFPGRGINLSTQSMFDVINTADGKSVYNGTLAAVKEKDSYTGENVFVASFDSLKAEGEYFIKIPGIPESYRFSIKKDIYADVLRDSMKYFYFQRQGMELTEEYAGIFKRKDLHPEDAAAKLLSQREDKNAPVYDVSGGWYDAGDFGKYLTPGAGAVSHLLFAYELFPDLFFDGQNHIPESNKDGLPDILSEVKYELDFFFKMENKITGGFYDLIPNAHLVPGWAESKARYIMDMTDNGSPGSAATAASLSAAAALAQAYIVYKDIKGYSDYAIKCLDASKKAWRFVASQGDKFTRGGDGAYATLNKGEISELKLWAAGVLYRATGEREYNDYFIDNHEITVEAAEKNIFNAWVSLPGAKAMNGYFNYLLAAEADSTVYDYFKANFIKYRDLLTHHYKNNGWGIALPEWAFWWGSTGTCAMLTPFTVYMGNKILGLSGAEEDKSFEMAIGAVNYMLGANPLAFSFVSGHGTDSLKYIHSGIFFNDGIDEIPKGYVPGGASSYNYGFVTHYTAKAYTDSDTNYTVNEHAIYWNAAFILCLSLAMASAE